MAGVDIKLHPQANIRWAPVNDLVGVLGIVAQPLNGNSTAPGPDEIMGLALIDPDGETHVYVISPEGRAGLLEQMLGGIVTATLDDLPS